LAKSNPSSGNGRARSDVDAVVEELLARGEPAEQIAANCFAISSTPEDRREPEPSQLFARVTIREARRPAIKSDLMILNNPPPHSLFLPVVWSRRRAEGKSLLGLFGSRFWSDSVEIGFSEPVPLENIRISKIDSDTHDDV
jgi:hypothetical protein